MKKYKVLKHLPGIAKIGDIWEGNFVTKYQIPIECFNVELMLNTGWLEEVKEIESLEDKLKYYFEEYSNCSKHEEDICLIAQEHYVEVIKNAHKRWTSNADCIYLMDYLINEIKKS